MVRRAAVHEEVVEPVLEAAAMRRLDATLQAVAARDVTVTLVGESGTGKEVLARRIHALSPRGRGPFVPINCAAIPEALFESELFGHERGAFTGASELARGKVEAASGGTLFLDEIAEMPLTVQAKLLRFLENRRFMRLGGSAKLEADVRLVCATLRPLEDEVRYGRFREDLLYRVQGLALRVPPLRERRVDIPRLLERFTAQCAARHGTAPPHYGRDARAALRAYAWPGNVRELRNTVEQLCMLRAGTTVRRRDLPEAIRGAAGERESPAEVTLSLHQTLDEMVEQILDAVLLAEGGNQTRAAKRLGLSVRTIQRHLAGRDAKRDGGRDGDEG